MTAPWPVKSNFPTKRSAICGELNRRLPTHVLGLSPLLLVFMSHRTKLNLKELFEERTSDAVLRLRPDRSQFVRILEIKIMPKERKTKGTPFSHNGEFQGRFAQDLPGASGGSRHR